MRFSLISSLVVLAVSGTLSVNVAAATDQVAEEKAVAEVTQPVTTESQIAELISQGRAFYAVDNMSEAMPVLQQAARLGSAEAIGFLGYILDKGGEIEIAIPAYEEAAKLNDPLALHQLAEIYMVGRGIDADLEKGKALLERAVAQDYAAALFTLAKLHETGEYNYPQDHSVAFKWYKQASELDETDAIGRIIKVYDKGELGQAIDPVQAEYWRQHLKQVVQGTQQNDEEKLS